MGIESEIPWLADFLVRDQKATKTFLILVLTFWKVFQNSEIYFLTIEQTVAVVFQTREMYFKFLIFFISFNCSGNIY